MDADIVEQLDRRRYKSNVIETVGFGLLCGSLALAFMFDGVARDVFIIISALGMPVLIIGALGSFKVWNILRKNPELEKILNDELYRSNSNKAGALAFSLMMIFLFPVMALTVDFIPTASAMFILAFVGTMTNQIALLVLNRQQKDEGDRE